ncbi:MAG: hypothetical protein OXU78_10960 [Deltaproteobacteria bacterium]|nr:hypothetical protein [Deltaproteobacteria bacterium]MDD9884089.1 hypothetical protein [Gammaproteobacteria bacterium]
MKFIDADAPMRVGAAESIPALTVIPPRNRAAFAARFVGFLPLIHNVFLRYRRRI